MADNLLSRKNRDIDITLATATASATTLDMRDVAGAVVSFGTMSTNASTLQMWVGTAPTGTFRRLYKSDGSVLISRWLHQARMGEPMPCPMKCLAPSTSRSSQPPRTAPARQAS
jgi:hypothetical protein